jgi:hypothetical protein
MAGLIFACGYYFGDLLKTQIVSWFSFLQPIILLVALEQYLKTQKKRKDK